MGLIEGTLGGVIGSIAGVLIGIFLSHSTRDKLMGLTMGSMIGGLIGGLMGSLRNGGISCIQHLVLRRILYFQGCIPWNYAEFLDYATELRLMKKVGGGYIFYHRMLMEHFAGMELEK